MKIVTLLTTLLLLTTALIAESPDTKTQTKKWQKWQISQFKGSDRDKDGYVDFDELIGFHVREKERKGTKNDPRKTATWWMKLKDLDKDGKLTMEEFHYWKKKK